MNILYDDNMPFAADVFTTLGNATTYNHQRLAQHDLAQVDAMMIRSTTKVDAALIGQLPRCQYLATATAGYNHLDLDTLGTSAIQTYIAAGCNAESVAEYALSGVLYALLQRQQIHLGQTIDALESFTVGVVGLGQVGRRVQAKFVALGMQVHGYDPLRADAEAQPQWHDLDQVLACDIICLHAPLVKTGPYPSAHLFNAEVLARLQPHQILLNAGRGEVIDNQALLRQCEAQLAPCLILDVWEHEPDILQPLIAHCLLATPHIAGHSMEGKTRGTFMLYDWLCQQTDQPITQQMHDFLPDAIQHVVCADEQLTIASLSTLVWSIYDIAIDHSEFVANMAQSPSFAKLRKTYRDPAIHPTTTPRREFDTLNITCTFAHTQTVLSALGFTATTL